MVNPDGRASLVDRYEVLGAVTDTDEDIARGDPENLLITLGGLLEDEVSAERLAKEVEFKVGSGHLQEGTGRHIDVDRSSSDLHQFLNLLVTGVDEQLEVAAEADVYSGHHESNRSGSLASESGIRDDERSFPVGDFQAGIIFGAGTATISEEDVQINDANLHELRRSDTAIAGFLGDLPFGLFKREGSRKLLIKDRCIGRSGDPDELTGRESDVLSTNIQRLTGRSGINLKSR